MGNSKNIEQDFIIDSLTNSTGENFSRKIFQNIKTMGLIKEPDGVDFVIQSPPLTDKEREEISEFIRTRKLENKRLDKRIISKKTNKIST
jgi:hypothetical protein